MQVPDATHAFHVCLLFLAVLPTKADQRDWFGACHPVDDRHPASNDEAQRRSHLHLVEMRFVSFTCA